MSTRTTTWKRATIAALAAGAALTAAAAAPGDAAAATKAYPLNNCINISPNIVDVPYMPSRAIVSEYAGTTYIAIDYTSYWIGVGYDSAARLDWHNLQTNRRGTLHTRSHVSPPYSGVHNFTVPRAMFGPGKVKLTLTTTNSNALWAIPARSCSGVVVAP